MDKSVPSSKTLGAGVLRRGIWCSLRTSPLGLRSSVAQPRLERRGTGSRPEDARGGFLVLRVPSPQTWKGAERRVRGGRAVGAGLPGRGAP